MDLESPEFAQSFSLEEPEALCAFFKEYGFVVVRDVLSPEQCAATVDDIYGLLESMSEFQRDDRATWSAWPVNSIERYGSPQRDPVFLQSFLKNRQNPNVYKAFSLLLCTDDLLVNHDRCCFFRPTDNNPSWATTANIHLDMNPWHWMSPSQKARAEFEQLSYDELAHFIIENNQPCIHDGLQLQGILNLEDNEACDGGLALVPGFHDAFVQHFKALKPHNKPSHSWTPKDSVFQRAQRVPMRRGSLALWDQRLPHGSLPNRGNRPRIAQMVKMFPASTVSDERFRRRAAAVQRVFSAQPYSVPVSHIGRIVFGMQPRGT